MWPAQATVVVDVYNNGCMGWEPVVEPWVAAASLHCRGLSGSTAAAPAAPHHCATITAEKPLELTSSLPTADAAAVCNNMLRGGGSRPLPCCQACCQSSTHTLRQALSPLPSTTAR